MPKVLAVGIDTPRPRLDISAILQNLSRYWRVSVVEVTGSTQDDLFELASNSRVASGEVIVAEFQSKGRGRLDRSFDAAPRSALTFSFFYKPQLPREKWQFITLLSGLSVTKALRKIDSDVNIAIKWPNDLLISAEKVSGMIAQATDSGVVVGIGINVGMNQSELPVETATSLALNNYKELNRNIILTAILNQLEIDLQRWEEGVDILSEYRISSATIGKNVEVSLPSGEKLSSKAIGITDSGELQLESGTLVSVGDVVHLR